MVAAIEKNLQECFKSFRVLEGSTVTDTPELVAVRSPIPLTFTNGVALARFDDENLHDRIDEVIRPYKEAHVPFRWWVTPSSSPASLSAALEQHGLRRVFEIPTMSAILSEINDEMKSPPRFSVESVHDVEGLRSWSKTFCIGFEMPGESTYLEWIAAFAPFGFGELREWRHYVGVLDGEPVAISSMFLGSEAAGIYHVVTLPAARGLGIGTIMTLAPLLEARELGYKIGVLQSSDKGFSVYTRIGFVKQCVADFFVWRPESLALKS